MAEIEPCTTRSRRKRHYSDSLTNPTSGLPGRDGITLCGQGAQDEERANWWLARWSGKRIVVADLPERSLCCRSKAKRASVEKPVGRHAVHEEEIK